MAAPLNLRNPQRPIHVGVILMDSVTEILDVAPIDFLSSLQADDDFGVPEEMLPPGINAQKMEFCFHWVSKAGPPQTVKLTAGIKLEPTDSFETCPPLDIVLIGAHNLKYTPTEEELAFVRKAWNDCSAFLTICGGVDVPRHAGLLKGKTVTGPRPFLPMVRQMSPEINWVEKRWVRDGKLWTSSTLLNGTDMMAAFAKETWGNKVDEGETCLVEYTQQMGAWPSRDLDFKDVPWAI